MHATHWRLGIARPRWTLGGRAVVPFDEDEFTLAVRALERAGVRTGTIHWAGRRAEVADDDLAAALGGPVTIVDHGAGLPAVESAALGATADAAEGRMSAFLAVSAPRERADGSPAGALAAAGGRSTPAGPRRSLDRSTIEGSDEGEGIFRAAGRWWRSAAEREAVEFGGLAEDHPHFAADAAPYFDRWRVAEATATRTVSQGAYLPKARYQDGRLSRWRLIADRCSRCSSTTFPQRGACGRCGATDGLAAVELPREGRVVASTRIAPGSQPTEFDPIATAEGGYGVVLVELAPGVRATLMVADAPTTLVGIGARVATQLRRLYGIDGEWRYGRKAVGPLDRGPSAVSPPPASSP